MKHLFAQRSWTGPEPCFAVAGSKIKQSGQSRGFGGGARRAGGSTRSRTDEARDLLANVIVCHIPCPRYDFTEKVRRLHPRICPLNVFLAAEAMLCDEHQPGPHRKDVL